VILNGLTIVGHNETICKSTHYFYSQGSF